MDSAVSEKHIAKMAETIKFCQGQSDLCWQNQPIQERPSPGAMCHHIPFLAFPQSSTLQPSEDAAILQKEIQSLCRSRPYIKFQGFYLNVFLVVPKKDEHFKMKVLYRVKALLRRSDWMAKVDLKDVIFIVPIAPQFCHLLHFKEDFPI